MAAPSDPGEPPETTDLPEVIRIDGVVVPGDRRSRQWGFPTANLPAADIPCPDGVYAGIVRRDLAGRTTAQVAAVSVGRRPVLGPGGPRLVEAHLLGFRGDLDAARLRIELCAWLRPQQTYPDMPALVRQLFVDVTRTKAWALRRGLRDLLPVGARAEARWQRDGSGQLRRVPVRDETTVSLRRALRREELIRAAVRDAPQDVLDHELVSLVTGLPVGYLKWRYPTIEVLRAAVGG
ncbi:riboflavin kinase [Nocardioides sp.]|uniref:riboflavin kinase n=1 Tax=Nocardioides sp. TaxID=35761 RepID=UPI0039E55A96